MKTMSVALKAHLASRQTTMATCWLAKLKDNTTTYAFTDHDKDITISGWSSPDNILHETYTAASGIVPKAISTTDALNVDSTEVQSILSSDSITEDDLRAGRWDFARIYIFQVNWADITMGPYYQRVGWLGEVHAGRNMFNAELRGLMQLYTRNLINLTSPMCRARFGDAMCGVVLTGSPSYQFTHAIDGVNEDNQTFYCAALTQPGPSSGVAITSITQANPGVVTLADDTITLVENQAVTLYDVGGMIEANGSFTAKNVTATTFEIVDTTSFSAYTSGGMMLPLGSGSGYFDHGIVTWLTGANQGLQMEVKSYAPGQVTLALPMPFTMSAGSPQDTFTITAGCNKSYAACKGYNNLRRFRGEPFVAGFDKMVQVGRQGTT